MTIFHIMLGPLGKMKRNNFYLFFIDEKQNINNEQKTFKKNKSNDSQKGMLNNMAKCPQYSFCAFQAEMFSVGAFLWSAITI